ncbi:MAG: M20/M25/M40 family metallo-hydrolase [Candidatus Cloacimonas sp.]|jgi:aminopeptidase YwaD|nr:M20/M25/M40 family metallo-hydrolase [Candidatus Cloacimonas sp.]
MKKLSVLVLVLSALGLLRALPNYVIGIPADNLVKTYKTTTLREAVSQLSDSGIEVYYYNDHQVIAGSNNNFYPNAKLLCGINEGNLYLVTKLADDKGFDICGKELLDLGHIVLLQSNLNEIELRQHLKNPFTNLEFKPMQFPQTETKLNRTEQTRTDIEAMITQVSADSVMAFIQALQDMQTRYALADNRMAVANWIKNQYLRFGISNAELHTFQWQNTTQYNVVATITGSVYPETYIIVGGHHDSITYATPLTFAPGADDNASGSVAAIEMARVMMATGFQPKCSIRFITYAAEEFGLWGSKAYAQYAHNTNMDIRLMINHDMIANTTPDNNDLRVLLMPYDGYIQHTDHAAALTSQYTDLIPVYGSMNSSSSDSYSYYQQGYPVIYYFEYNFSQVYHSNNDLTANINPVYCAKVIRASTAVAASYANMPSAPLNLRVLDTGTGTSLGVFWDANTDPSITHYKVAWGSENGVYPNSQTTTGTQIVINGLITGLTYYVAVSALDSADNESYRIFAYGTPFSIPLTPWDFADSPSHSVINLSWMPNSELDLASYKLYRSLDSVEQGNLLATLPATAVAYGDTNVTGSSAYYYYRLCAVDNQGNQSPFTDVLKSRPVSLNHGILVVDETKNYSGTSPFQPTDEMVDSFYAAMLDDFQVSDLLDLEATPGTLKLADLGIYSSILWHGNDSSEISYPSSIRDALREYIYMGGNVFFSLYQPTQGIELNFGYPATFPGTSFISEALGIGGADYTVAARFKYALPQMDNFPMLQVDSLKTTANFDGHIFRVEGLVPVNEGESVYAYGSDYDNTSSQGSLNGDKVGVLHQYGLGKALTLSFPLYHMQQESARQMVFHVFNSVFSESSPVTDPFVPSVNALQILPNFPNPFIGETTIPIKTKSTTTPMNVEIYNLKGQLVTALFSGLPNTKTNLHWDGRDSAGNKVSSGIYFVKVQQQGQTSSRKMLLLK